MPELPAFLSLKAEVLRVGGVFLVVSALVALFFRKERRNVLHLALLYGVSLVFRSISQVLDAAGMPDSARTVGFLAVVLQGIAFLGLATVVIFAVILHVLRIEAPRILRDLTVALSYVALVFYLFSRYNVDVAGVVATSAVVTAVIGFSLQDTLGNVMGGLALQLDGSITVGDWVLFQGVSGIVREIRWRHLSIETRNGDTLIIPNSVLMKNQVLLQGRRADDPDIKERRPITFNVDYRFPPTAVIDAVTEALCRAPITNVAATPPPNVIVMDYKDSFVQYAARYWLTDIFLDEATDSLVRTRIFFALQRAGIPLSIPAQTVFVTPEDERRIARLEEKERARREQAVADVAIFQTLTGDERTQLAKSLILAPFSRGESIVLQGHAVDHLYVLSKGVAEVRVTVEGAPQRVVAQLQAPDFFGEMGMLTGEPRRATVVALTDVECWRLEKGGFQAVLSARPQIADDISHVLATRQVNLAAVREGLSEEARRLRLANEHDSILGKIQRFFRL